MEEIKLSVIVPVYNAAEFLDECVQSLLKQNIDGYEIILVNDGSKDDSASICSKYANKYSFVKFIDQKNQGQMKASQNGLEAACGKYIGFVDSDDYVSEITFGTMLKAALEEDADIVTMAGVRFCDKTEKPFQDKLNSGIFARKEIEDYIIPNIFSNHDLYGNRGIQPSKCLKIFRHDLIESTYKMIPTDIEMGEDLLTTYTAIAQAQKLVILDKSLIGYHYRLNTNSISWVHKNNLFNKSMKLCSSLRNIPSLIDNDRFQKEVDYEVCFFAINAFLNEYLMKNDAKMKERKIELEHIINSHDLDIAINRIDFSGIKMPNKLFTKLMKKKKINVLHRVGMVISAFKAPITYISQKII